MKETERGVRETWKEKSMGRIEGSEGVRVRWQRKRDRERGRGRKRARK